MTHFPRFFSLSREELHAIASAKKLSSKNKALSDVRAFRREPLREEEGPNFDKETEVIPDNRRIAGHIFLTFFLRDS